MSTRNPTEVTLKMRNDREGRCYVTATARFDLGEGDSEAVGINSFGISEELIGWLKEVARYCP